MANYKKVADEQKFVRLNTNKTSEIIDKVKDCELITFRELQLILSLVQIINYEDNTITLSKDVISKICVDNDFTENFIRKSISKLKKMNIVEKDGTDVYHFTCVNFGELTDDEDDYIKVSKVTLARNLKKSDTVLSGKEILLFFYFVCRINTLNIVNFDKNTKETICKKFEISRPSLDIFTKKMKELGLWEKLNNKEYKFNTMYFKRRDDFTTEQPVSDEVNCEITEHPLLECFKKDATINKFFK